MRPGLGWSALGVLGTHEEACRCLLWHGWIASASATSAGAQSSWLCANSLEHTLCRCGRWLAGRGSRQGAAVASRLGSRAGLSPMAMPVGVVTA